MMGILDGFDPVSARQSAALNENKVRQIPVQNQLLALEAKRRQQQIEYAPQEFALQQQAGQRQQQQLDLQQSQETRLQNAQNMKQLREFAPFFKTTMQNIKNLPPEQRQQSFIGSMPMLMKLGLHDGQLGPEDTSDAGLDEAISFADALISVNSVSGGKGRTAAQKNFSALQQITAQEKAGQLPPGSAKAFANEVGLLTSEQEAAKEATVASAKKGAELREKRVSDVRAELGERSRSAIRQSATVREALQASSNATQGIPGAVKVQLGRLFPGIDTADEAAMDSALKDLAVQQLQSFKGPTTDFEFVQVQNITGRLSDGRSANEARLASLDRAMWFMNQELAQFDRYIATGGDPDKWLGFDYDETVQTQKGPISMKDLRDTAAANHITVDETLRRLNR